MKKVGKTSTILLDSCGKLFEVVGSSMEVVDSRSKDIDLSGSSELELLFICGVPALRSVPSARPIGRATPRTKQKRPQICGLLGN